MKKLIIGLGFFVSANCFGGINDSVELVANAQIIEIESTRGGNARKFYLTLKGGTGKCANQKVTLNIESIGSVSLFTRNYSTALTAFSLQLKTVSMGGYKSEHGCDQITYIKLTNPSD